MRLALISDTHDDAPMTQAALAALRPHHPDVYLHAGDLVSPHMLALFAGLPLHFVFGNNEYDLATIRSRALAENLKCLDTFGDLQFAGKKIALLHGHDSRLLYKVSASATFDYVIHGHTHLRKDQPLATHGKTTRVINPGAVHRARVKTVALLNLATDELQFLELPNRP